MIAKLAFEVADFIADDDGHQIDQNLRSSARALRRCPRAASTHAVLDRSLQVIAIRSWPNFPPHEGQVDDVAGPADGRCLDDNYDADGIAALFTEDATWDSPGLGRFEGREAIRGFFRGAAGIFSFAIHYSLNGQIYVDGDTAWAQWYLFMPCTVAEGNRAMWRASIDHEHYRRVDGSWLFSGKRSQPLMNVPFDEGWARRRFV